MSFLETLRTKRSPALIAGAVAVAVLALAGLTAWYVLQAQGGSASPSGAGGLFGRQSGRETGAVPADGAEPAAAPAPPADIFVHVAGAVVAPGVYKLGEGQRVVDALLAAAGGTTDAAIDSINLAQPLTDGQRIYVPTKREVKGAAPGTVYTGGKPFTPPGSGSGADATKRLVNINTATNAELDTIPGIGPVLAERIIAWRTANGPFKSTDDLRKVSGIGDKTLQDIKPYVTTQ